MRGGVIGGKAGGGGGGAMVKNVNNKIAIVKVYLDFGCGGFTRLL